MVDKMNLSPNQLEKLSRKLETIQKKQADLQKELDRLALQISGIHPSIRPAEVSETEFSQPAKGEIKDTGGIFKKLRNRAGQKTEQAQDKLERFIGENLFNKIGIVILVIGISIGVKYAIDHNLISPVMRIILGYFAGAILLVLAWRMKDKYQKFSAVLLSGAMSSMYFITYAAFTYYDLFPRLFTFGIMVAFTVFTVLAALRYDRQVIAHIGLLGAYAIPFLVGDPESKASVMFSYMIIINAGILYISYFKYWKYLSYAAFIFTWAIFIQWYFNVYNSDNELNTAFIFSILFFGLFQAILLMYKLLKNKVFSAEDILFLIANATVFYGTGYSILDETPGTEKLTGLYTLVNALIHAGIALLFYMKKPADKSIFYYAAGLAIIFFTIAIPVQFNGSWVTLIWAGEAAVLLWLGKRSDTRTWIILAHLLMILAFFSIVNDWMTEDRITPKDMMVPIFNFSFLTTIIFSGFFAFMLWVASRFKTLPRPGFFNELNKLFGFLVPSIFILVIYVAFFREISLYWDQILKTLRIEFNALPEDMKASTHMVSYPGLLKDYWLINYTLLFAMLFTVLNLLYLKIRNLASFLLILNLIVIIVFLSSGLTKLGMIRESYLQPFETGDVSLIKNLYRYLSYFLTGFILLFTWRTIKQNFYDKGFIMIAEFLFHIMLIIVASAELVNLMELGGSGQSNKLGLSILWGIYSLLLIVLGIIKKKKYLRIWAIILFALTLMKLFFYDLTTLDTVSKTIVFVILGTLLLIISYLYNRFKNLILSEKD